MVARLAGLLLLLAAPAAAQQVVTSPGPEAVSVTIYRNPNGGGEMDLDWLNGYAFITETRTVSLPAGESVIRFEGVAGNILPASAIVRNLPRQPAEKNHDARLLSAGALVDAFLGRQVHIRRTDRATGRVTESEAIIRSGPEGIILQTAEGIEALRCSGLPETLVYNEVPPGLSDKPTLAVTTSAPEPVTATVSLSYLAGQFDWRANYVANVAPGGRTLELFAWLTLANANDESFPAASVQAVAGRPNREGAEDENEAKPYSPEIRLSCWPAGTTSDGAPRIVTSVVGQEEYFESGDITVTGSRIRLENFMSSVPVTVVTAALEQLGDLKLYRIPEAVTVAANAQKQVALLNKPKVRFERLHGLRLRATGYQDSEDEPWPASILLRTRNVEGRGLGVPLPSGTIAIFEQAAGRPMLVGEAPVYDTPVGEELELLVGQSADIAATQRFVPRAGQDEDDSGDDDKPRDFEILLTNASPAAAQVEVRLRLDDEEGEKLTKPSRKLSRKDGSPLWRARVPAGGRARLAYTIERKPIRELDEDEED
jgi:hypothetical protein